MEEVPSPFHGNLESDRRVVEDEASLEFLDLMLLMLFGFGASLWQTGNPDFFGNCTGSTEEVS